MLSKYGKVYNSINRIGFMKYNEMEGGLSLYLILQYNYRYS